MGRVSDQRVLVLGGDGFCGWPTALHLSGNGYDVAIVDDLSRRNIDEELQCESLTPIHSMEERITAWTEVSGKKITFHQIDIATEYHRLVELLRVYGPRSVIHFAEQRAAPYSMKSPVQKRYTVDRNINATHNLLCAIVESGLDIHVIHLGTMGVYGYGTINAAVPEGYLKVKVEEDSGLTNIEIPYPSNPGSVYHMTKCMDAMMFQYYNKNDNIRVTDLHQGIVWGTNIEETLADDRLINRFDYDGDYGTVLNRFLIEAAIGYPLTVHGTGGQTRAFIHIRNTVEAVKLAINSPPESGDRVKIVNQATEIHTVRDLAEKVSALTGAEIKHVANPRIEAEENNLEVKNDQLLKMGLKPVLLEDALLEELVAVAKKFQGRCDPSKIPCRSVWRSDIQLDDDEKIPGHKELTA